MPSNEQKRTKKFSTLKNKIGGKFFETKTQQKKVIGNVRKNGIDQKV